MMLRSKIIILITFYFLLHPFNLLKAQWSNDPNQNLQISNFGIFVDACEDGNGGAFIAWRTPTNTGIDVSVWMQWVDRYGYVRWAQPFQVLGQGDGQSDQQIIYSGNNTAIIAFGDRFDKGPHPIIPGYRLYKSRLTLNKVDTLGNFLWGSAGITASIDTTHNLDVVIAPDESGGAYLTWGDVYPLWSDRDSTIVRLQRISANGQRLWGDSGRYVYKESTFTNPEPHLSKRLPEGIFLTYWKRNIGTFMESINADGSINWSNVNNWYRRPIPARDGGGAWAYKYQIPSTGENLIMANRIDAQGNLIWSDSGLVVERGLPTLFSVSDFRFLPDTSLVIFWKQSFNSERSNFKSYIQIINTNGSFQFPDSSKLITESEGEVIGLRITISDSLKFILNWQDSRPNNPGFYCQKYNKNLQKLWNNNDILYSIRDQEDPVRISDKKMGFIAIWNEFASPDFGVFAQQVSRNGVLGEIITKINPYHNPSIPEQAKLFQNYPNPFNSSTIIPFYLPRTFKTQITIYNGLGQTVRNLFQRIKPPGHHTVHWDGTDDAGHLLPSGVYYIELKTIQNKQIKQTLFIK